MQQPVKVMRYIPRVVLDMFWLFHTILFEYAKYFFKLNDDSWALVGLLYYVAGFLRIGLVCDERERTTLTKERNSDYAELHVLYDWDAKYIM